MPRCSVGLITVALGAVPGLVADMLQLRSTMRIGITGSARAGSTAEQPGAAGVRRGAAINGGNPPDMEAAEPPGRPSCFVFSKSKVII